MELGTDFVYSSARETETERVLTTYYPFLMLIICLSLISFIPQMKLWITALVLTLGCLIPSFAEEDSEPKVLASKNILNHYLVEGKDLTVEYRIYNVGSRYVKKN